MKKAILLLGVAFAILPAQMAGQISPEQKPNEAEIAAYKRQVETLLHPRSVISIRLAALGREPSTTPPPYTGDNWMHFQMFVSQASGEDLTYGDDRNRCYAYRPELIMDGNILSYSKEAHECVERAEREPWGDGYSHALKTLISGREYATHYVNLEDWYEMPLPTGHYQLLVRKQFYRRGDWVESNPVTFDVVPRRIPSALPDGFKVRLVIERPREQTSGEPYRLGYNDGLAMELVNESDRQVYVSVIDQLYGHRPTLTKDGQVIPYSEEVTKLIDQKEKDARLVEVVNAFFLDPKTVQRLDGFSLKQWYGPLSPGIYHLTDRRRFEIGGPWTKDSAELIFEIIP